jgi:hypothetical protein
VKKITLCALLLIFSNPTFSEEQNENAKTLNLLENLDTAVLKLKNNLEPEDANMFQWLQHTWNSYTAADCLWASKLETKKINLIKYNLCMQKEISHRISVVKSI